MLTNGITAQTFVAWRQRTNRVAMTQVRIRRACNLHLRHALHLLCDLSRARCTWAMTYYEGLKERGKTHAQALRCLGQRWLKIIFRMWHSRELYDGELHTRTSFSTAPGCFKTSPPEPAQHTTVHVHNSFQISSCNR